MKTTILGNSVALRVRPPIKAPNNNNYTSLLKHALEEEHKHLTVENKATGAATVININSRIDFFINSFPDWYIINLGVVDACSRDVPLWIYRIITKKSDIYFFRLLRRFYFNNFMANYRKFLVMLRFYKPWVSQKRFAREYERLVSTLLKETNAQIIVLPINLASDRIEKALPRSRQRQIEYNEVIKHIAWKYKIQVLDISDLQVNKHYPDGVHYNNRGHKKVAERIHNIIRGRLNT